MSRLTGAVEHLVVLGHWVEQGTRGVIRELNERLTSGTLVTGDLLDGDLIRVTPFLESPQVWYPNFLVYIYAQGQVKALERNLHEYGHPPREFYYPKYPPDYWLDSIGVDVVHLRLAEGDEIRGQDLELLTVRSWDGLLLRLWAVVMDDFLVVTLFHDDFLNKRRIAEQMMSAEYGRIFRPGEEVMVGEEIVQHEQFGVEGKILVLPEAY